MVTIHSTCNVSPHSSVFHLFSLLPDFLTIRHVLNIAAFCIRIYTAGLRLSTFKLSCNLLGIIPVADNISGNIYDVFSCRILKSSSFKAVYFAEFLDVGAVKVVTVRN